MKNQLVDLRRVSKTYPGVVALKDVDFAIDTGEVRALLGKNGAGKSTLIKVLAGVVVPDCGSIMIHGVAARFQSPADAIAVGIATVHQELSIVPELSVAENIFLGRWPKRRGSIAWREMFERAHSLLAELGFEIEPRVSAQLISPAQRQLVEIARALAQGAKILILDEPTSSLVGHEVNVLVGVIQRLARNGVGVIYISHRMDEIRRVADSVSVMRDGHHVKTARATEIGDTDIIELMLGQTVSAPLLPTRLGGDRQVMFAAQALALPTKIVCASFEIRSGEVTGIAGVLGAGRTELLEAMVGRRWPAGGTMTLDGKPYCPTDLRAARRAGVFMTPEDRRGSGAVVGLGCDENLVMANWSAVSRWGVIDRASMSTRVAQSIRLLGIKLARPDEALANLSGGNQQKVVIGKALNAEPRLLLLDEPTRGVDIGAKHQIYVLMRRLADQGMAIVFVSGELEEFPGVCDRVLVLRQGCISAELTGDAINTVAIHSLTSGVARPAPKEKHEPEIFY